MGKLLVEIVLHSLGPLVNSIEFMPDKLEICITCGIPERDGRGFIVIISVNPGELLINDFAVRAKWAKRCVLSTRVWTA